MLNFIKKYWLYISLVVGLIFYFFFKRSVSSPVTSSSGKTASTNQDLNINMGQKNNNPMNVRNGDDNWQGGVNGSNGFVKFVDIEHGYRAGIKTLWTYYNTHKLRTIHDIIHRYAPLSENDTTGYVNFVSKGTGIPANAPIEFNRVTMDKIICEMSQMETAMRPTNLQLQKAWELSSL